jgi:hypothetical protein
MNDFLKCAYPHCGQSIEYPAEGSGQIVPCPTCEKQITLTPTIQAQTVLVSVAESEPSKLARPDKEPRPPEYLCYPPEPSQKDFNSGSDFDYIAANINWTQEVRKREAINRRLFEIYLAAFKLWSAGHNPGTAWEPKPLFPKSPLPPSQNPENITILETSKPRSVTVPERISSPIPAQQRVRPTLSNLTAETIRAKSRGGNTPLHLAAKNGKMDLIPSHLLSVELFMDRNNAGNTPLHIAAKHGNLGKVPRQFLTKETLTIPNKVWITGSGYEAHGPTALYVAATSGYVDQIPREFFTPEFLLIETTGYRETLLQYIVKIKRVDLLPHNYASLESWNLKNNKGQTPRQILEYLIQLDSQTETWRAEREAYVAHVRSEPATEKQKEKLRWFGCAFDENMTKGRASDALDKCVRDFPEKESAYYSRPATEEQMATLRKYCGKEFEGGEYTYEAAKYLIRQKQREYEDEQMRYEFVFCGFIRWREERYRHLTSSRVRKAFKALDKTNPGWIKNNNSDCENLLLQKVTELYPELAAKEGWE